MDFPFYHLFNFICARIFVEGLSAYWWKDMCAGFFVTIWIAAVMFKSNDILKKQTALKVGIMHYFINYWPRLINVLIYEIFTLSPLFLFCYLLIWNSNEMLYLQQKCFMNHLYEDKIRVKCWSFHDIIVSALAGSRICCPFLKNRTTNAWFDLYQLVLIYILPLHQLLACCSAYRHAFVKLFYLIM